MRKSTVIMIITAIMALAWILVFYWMAGTSILDARNGRKPRFAIAPPAADTLVSIMPPSFSSLDFAGGNIMVMIREGGAFQLTMKQHLKKEMIWYIHDSTLCIRIKKIINKKSPDTLVISVPALKSVFARAWLLKKPTNNGLLIDSLSLPELKVVTEHMNRVNISNCRISSLEMDILQNQRFPEIAIASSCSIDSLSVCIPGPAKLKLETAGLFKNSLRLSDAVRIQSTSRILQTVFRNSNQ